MYSNTGSKIKSVASILSFLGIASCIVLGLFTLCIFVKSLEVHDLGMPPWLFLLIIGLGFVVSIIGAIAYWLMFLLLAGFGELIEETSKSASCLEEIKALLNKENTDNNMAELSKKDIEESEK